MAHPETATETAGAPVATTPPAAAPSNTGVSAEVQALIDAELAKFATANGITPPAAAAAAPSTPQPTALSALSALEGDLAHAPFVEKIAHLAENGYQAVLTEEQALPALKTVITIVGELAAKLA